MRLSKADDFKEVHVWSGDSLEVSALEESFFNKYLESLEKGDAVLDIGCGQGKLVKFLQQKGYKSAGIDLNAELIEAALSQGLPVQKMDALTAIQTQAYNYNVFSMLDFVEHIPLDAFLEILNSLSQQKNAKVWIQTPNLNSIMGLKFWFQVPSHITPLNPVVLRKLLHRFNYEIVAEWTDYGGLPWKGFRRWLALKILYGVFGAPMADMFLGGANICIVAKVRSNSSELQESGN